MSAISLTVDVLRSFHDDTVEETARHTAARHTPARPTTARPATPPPAAIGAPVPLPAARDAVLSDLLTTLRRRRAIRFFGDTPTPAGVVRAVVEAGLAADRRRWPGEHACCPLVPVVVAQRVDGLAPAAYHFDEGHAIPVMALGGRESYRAFTLQREFADAGAIISVMGDLERADHVHGGAGFRTLMTRAGAMAYRMWLTAIDHEFAGSVFAGFLPAAVRVPLRCDGVQRHQLFALALGTPGDPGTSDAAVALTADHPVTGQLPVAANITKGGDTYGDGPRSDR